MCNSIKVGNFSVQYAQKKFWFGEIFDEKTYVLIDHLILDYAVKPYQVQIKVRHDLNDRNFDVLK